MKLALVSDTHDNLPKIKTMVEIINEQKADLMLHAGDFIAPFSLNLLDGLNCPWLGVFGNNDGEKKGLSLKSKNRIKAAPYFYQIDSKRLALMHEFKDCNADILIYGHTHGPDVKDQDKLIINPGEVCGYLTNKSSLVILGTKDLKPEFIYF